MFFREDLIELFYWSVTTYSFIPLQLTRGSSVGGRRVRKRTRRFKF